MNHETEYLVLGGGPTGLGAACRLQEKNLDWHLLEAESDFGGLASSFVDENGFTWDLADTSSFHTTRRLTATWTWPWGATAGSTMNAKAGYG